MEVVKAAWAVPSNVTDPIVLTPSRKRIVPVGVPEAPEVTAAVNVTGCPEATGFAEELRVTMGTVFPVALKFPDKAMDCGFPCALSLIKIEPVSGNREVGLNCTAKVQLAPGARLDGQVEPEITKSVLARRAPVGSVTAVPPVLVSVMICFKLKVLAGWLWKVTPAGEMFSSAPLAPVPFSATAC